MTFTCPDLSVSTRQFLDRRGGGNSLLIAGAWEHAERGATLPTIDPATGGQIARIARADAADVDRAVAAAHAALNGWRKTTPANRARILWTIADLIEAHIDELAELETLDQG